MHSSKEISFLQNSLAKIANGSNFQFMPLKFINLRAGKLAGFRKISQNLAVLTKKILATLLVAVAEEKKTTQVKKPKKP